MTTPENGIYVLQGVVPAQIAAAPVAVKVVDLYNATNDEATVKIDSPRMIISGAETK